MIIYGPIITIIIILIWIFVPILINKVAPPTYNSFDVTVLCDNYYDGVNRKLIITYTVEDNVITSCRGSNYVMDGRGYIETCSVLRLKDYKYTSELITSITGNDKLSGTLSGGNPPCTYITTYYK